TDLRTLDDAAKSILLNREIIGINQDPLGIPGQRIRNEGSVQVFARRIVDGEAVALLNRGDSPAEIRVTAPELGLEKAALDVRDLWTNESQRPTDGKTSATVEPHGVKILRVHPAGP